MWHVSGLMDDTNISISPGLWYDLEMSPTIITVGDRGRMVLPSPLRRELRLDAGTRLLVVAQPDGSVCLRPFRTAAEQGYGLLNRIAPRRGSAVAELAAERKREAELER
jgi:AbrB family looped-hinge helix DNA binding protein